MEEDVPPELDVIEVVWLDGRWTLAGGCNRRVVVKVKRSLASGEYIFENISLSGRNAILNPEDEPTLQAMLSQRKHKDKPKLQGLPGRTLSLQDRMH